MYFPDQAFGAWHPASNLTIDPRSWKGMAVDCTPEAKLSGGKAGACMQSDMTKCNMFVSFTMHG